jgi:hypothetical protein
MCAYFTAYVVTAMLRGWHAGRQDANTYASEVLRRVTKQVRAHVRKNPGWQSLGSATGIAKSVVWLKRSFAINSRASSTYACP